MAKPRRTSRQMMHFYEQAPVEEVLERLRERAALDKLAEANRSKWRTRALFGGIGFSALWVVAVVLVENNLLPVDAAGPVVGGVVVMGLLTVIVSLIVASRAGRADVEDRKYELALEVLEPLAPEIKPGRPVVLAVDFTGYDQRRPLSTEKASFFSTVSTETYEHGWLELELPLRDGTTALVTGASQCKRKKKRKRKYTKITDKLREQLQVSFRPAKGRQLNADTAQAWARRLGAIPGLQTAGGRITSSQVQLRYRTGVHYAFSGRGMNTTSGEGLLTAPQIVQALVAAHRAVTAGGATSGV